jgi:hypothetical protein
VGAHQGWQQVDVPDAGFHRADLSRFREGAHVRAGKHHRDASGEQDTSSACPRVRGGAHQTLFRSTSCLAMMMRCISLVPSPMHINMASR